MSDVTAPPWEGIGLALPCVDAFGTGTPVLEVARLAEDAGLDHVWVPDHLIFHRPILESVTTLAAVAGATQRVGLGFAILNAVLRDVTQLAKQLSSLAVLAPDRLLLGVGLGGEIEAEFVAAGVDKKTRGRRLDETLELLRPLLLGEAVSHAGLQTVECPGLAPVPATVPPVIVGGRSGAALTRAARIGDAWMPMWMDPAQVAEHLTSLREQADGFGRPAPGACLVGFFNITDDEELGHEQAGTLIKQQYAMPYEKVRRWTLVGSVAQVAEQIQAYRDAGVQGFSLATAHPDPRTQVEPLAAVRAALA
ncbi:LLM class flavin-dependent oxidoreductase [Paraconexibacter antarcticus]|uniref:LLM class flavin-dependent oxidoreductase n=1 Tax=Paraconexibacter antarcticus TaxID=2949664 RepID=A0ABY5DRP5_9ACTN|nr:LLM class flavin-dependent oxidoreductase [Paraconexibacter antarcticus]UTI63601.1 LLM class flavin-dependent oxidoreductase [Paraconexibacter antarcticus]